jgi:hypothetical protein
VAKETATAAIDRPPRRRRRPRMAARAIALLVLLAVAVVCYAALIRSFIHDEVVPEARFPAPSGSSRAVELYAEVLAIDPVREVARIRLDVGAVPAGQPTEVVLGDGDAPERRVVHAGPQPVSDNFDIDLEGGSFEGFPLDRYTARVQMSARTAGVPLPVGLRIWERIGTWDIVATPQAPPTADGAPLRIDLRIERAGTAVIVALALYAAQALIASAALTVACLVFLRLRPAEPGFIGATAAMIFTLPALRNAMPGAPPLGVRADVLVFLWSELAVVIAMALIVFTWARTE